MKNVIDYLLERNIIPDKGQCIHVGAGSPWGDGFNLGPSDYFRDLGYDLYLFDRKIWYDDWVDEHQKKFPNNNFYYFQKLLGICDHNKFEQFVPDTDNFKVLVIDVDTIDYFIFASIEREYDIIIAEILVPDIETSITLPYSRFAEMWPNIEIDGVDLIWEENKKDSFVHGASLRSFLDIADYKGYYPVYRSPHLGQFVFINKKYKVRRWEEKDIKEYFSYRKDKYGIDKPEKYFLIDENPPIINPPLEIKVKCNCDDKFFKWEKSFLSRQHWGENQS